MASILSVIRKKPGFISLSGASDEQIKQAEDMLQVQFACDYREYVSFYGVASFSGHELTGLCTSPRLNVVDITRLEAECNPNIPRGFYVVEQLNIDSIVIWQSASGEIFQTMERSMPEKISDSLCEYIEAL